jgi:hypothetical protein
MAKASYVTKGGAAVVLEGTEEEVASLLQRLDGTQGPPSEALVRRITKKSGKASPMGVLVELIETGFFATPKELGSVRAALEGEGHFYPATTLSPLMLRLVRRRELRRIKEKNRWLYVM